MDKPDAKPVLPPFNEAEYRRRQKSGARVTAIILVAFCALTFFVTIAKMGWMQ
jgi:hypothetical protein